MNYSLLEIVIELVLTGVFFSFVMPKIEGATFRGGFVAGLAYAAVFQVVMFVVVVALVAGAAVAALLTLGGALLLVPFAILFGVCFLPALGLKTMVWLFPDRFGFRHTRALVLSGFALTVILVMSSLFASLATK